jgi:TPR repeat protein
MSDVRLLTAVMFAALGVAADDGHADELGYGAYLDSPKRIKCLYGYVTAKTGNFEAAKQIFEDCVRRWDDVYSLISLAQMYESGSGVPKDLERAAMLLKQGAEQPDEASYVSLARYHWGVTLAEGLGVAADPQAARSWLQSASKGGQPEADDYLRQMDAPTPPDSSIR